MGTTTPQLGSATHRRVVAVPWAALATLFLTIVVAIIGWVTITPNAHVTINTYGTDVSETQIRAALNSPNSGGTGKHEVKAYSGITVNVCGSGQTQHCPSTPGSGKLSVRIGEQHTWTSVSESWLKVPTGEKGKPQYPSAKQMISSAVDSAKGAGQESGQVSAAVHATIEAQGLMTSRSPLLWGSMVGVGLVAACLFGLNHRRRLKKRRRLAQDFSTASRRLATVLLRLESAELAALQLESAGNAGRQAKDLRSQQRKLQPRTTKLVKQERDLESRAPRLLPTSGDTTRDDVREFAEAAERLLQDAEAVTRSATLLSDAPTSSDVWDAEATPLLNAATVVSAMLERTGFADQGGVSKAVEDLQAVRDRVMALGAERAARGDGATRDEDAASGSDLASRDLDVLVEQTQRVSSVVQRLLNGALKPRAYRLEDKDLPEDLRDLTAVEGVRLRSRPGMLSRPLVAHRLRELQEDETPLTSQGLRSWWEDSAKDSESAEQDRMRRHEQRARKKAEREWLASLPPKQRRRVARQGNGKVIGGFCAVVLIFSVGAATFGGFIDFVKDRFFSSSAENRVTVVAMPQGQGFSDLGQMNHRLSKTKAYVPMKVAVVELPADAEADAVEQNPYLKELAPETRPALARTTVELAREQHPELYDPASGDLRHESVVVGVRPVKDDSGTRYRQVAWAWGPTPGSERESGLRNPNFFNTAYSADQVSYGVADEIDKQFSESFGKPTWMARPTTNVLIGLALIAAAVGGITLVVWLRTKPWEALGANGRRRRAADRSLLAVTDALHASYAREDESELDSVLLSQQAPQRSSSQSSSTSSDTAAGLDVEAERRRVRTRSRALALRSAEELAAWSPSERGTEEFTDRVTHLADLVSGLDSDEQDSAEAAQRYLDELA